MNKILLTIAFVCLSSCGIIKGSSNATVDSVIKSVNNLYPDDNLLEEELEDSIKLYTGLN